MHASSEAWQLPLPLTLALVLTAWVYLRGWISLRSPSLNGIQAWRAISFLVGLSLIWVAVASPIASWDGELLTAHMVQHLLLMTFGAPLILLGAPVRLVRSARLQADRDYGPAKAGHYVRWENALVLRRPMQRIGRALARPAVCWCAATAALVGWHIPAAFTAAMQSHTWHAIELASFLVAGILFWLPVVQARPDASTSAGWSIVAYLFLATLPCDILSAFLVFSERVAYPIYLSTPRLSGLSALEDQQLAGALMWTVVTIVYLTAGAIVSARFLSPLGGARQAHEGI
jgi:cytochrome c oxidase assembly factor CtaG